MIKNIIHQYKTNLFLIAYSGGLDSTVLLHQLVKIKKTEPFLKIRAIHINHNCNIFSKEWSLHCQKNCQKNQIPLVIKDIKIKEKNQNIEEILRIKRYNIFYKNLLHNEILLTGHHMNDQCETFFLSLKRGSGPSGLSSMSFETLLGNKKIVRPFLHIKKEELESWAYNHQLNWIEDFSNSNVNYDRNFIRHNIIPQLEKKWPFFLKNCFRTINICKEETILLRDFLDEKICNIIQFDRSLNISSFKILKKQLAIALIRHWLLLQKIKMPSYKNIEQIYYQMIFSKKDANPKIVLKKYEIRRYRQSLHFIQTLPCLKKVILFWNNINMNLVLPNHLGSLIQNSNGVTLPLPKNNELINIRFQCEGNILILGKNKTRQVKKIWQEKNIPPWLRNQIPLLFYNNVFISALGVFVVNIKNANKNTWTIAWQDNLKLNCKDSFLFY